jgi:alkylation response protein AidB-like acyl-CoA dehydrogenase
MLMMLKSCTEAMRALAYYSALQLDLEGAADVGRAETARKRVMVLTPIVKGWCTELAQELVSLGVQIHGGMGYIEETGAAQILRDARITTIYEGTTGIQANDLVGRKLIPDNGEVLKALLEEIAALDGTLGAAGAPLGAIRAALAQGVAAAEEAVDYVLAGSREDEQLPGAVAVNLLLLMGTLLGGWRLAHTSLVAHAALRAQPAGDESFLGAKLITARFYAEHVMPRIGGLRAAVLAGSGSVMGLSEEQFSN